MATTSAEIVELVRLKIGDAEWNRASDSAVARALKVSHTMIGRYLKGSHVMGMDVLGKALQILKLPPSEAAEFVFNLSMDNARDEAARAMLEPAHRWFIEQAKNFVPAKPLAGILLAFASALSGGFSPSAQAVTGVPNADGSAHALYIMCT